MHSFDHHNTTQHKQKQKQPTLSTMRRVSELSNPPPPPPLPSPIPTGKGSRSAADEIFSEYLQKSLHVPNLALPEPHTPLTIHQFLPAEINYRSLESRDSRAQNRVLKSVREFGAFRLTAHGISGEELGSLVKEADRVFRVLKERDMGFGDGDGNNDNNKKQITWVCSAQERTQWAREFIEPETYRDFSEKMENVASKLDAITLQLFAVFAENIGKKQSAWKGIQGKGSVLNLYRHNHHNKVKLNPPLPFQKNIEPSDHHTMCLHIAAGPSQFFVHSAQGPLSFDAGPDTIVVTVGKCVEEWSLGDLKCVSGEVICEPHLQGSQASHFIELKCFSLNFDMGSKRNYIIVSIKDQILIGLILASLYNFLVFLFS